MNEKKTDQWVRKEIEMLVGDNYSEQTSNIKEVKKALVNASKTGGKGVGKPEFVFLINNCLFIVEDKLRKEFLVKLNDRSEIDLTIPDATNKFALNGAVHYAKHITQKAVGYDEVIAIGATGSSESRDTEVCLVKYDIKTKEHTYRRIGRLENWSEISPDNFDKWYGTKVLGNLSEEQEDELEMKSFAAQMHEDLRNYANLEGENKATVVSAILLALFDNAKIALELKEEEINDHTKEVVKNDGIRIYNAVENFMKKQEISPEFKVNVVMEKFQFLRTNIALNKTLSTLGNKTPLKYFTEELSNIMHHFHKNTEFDILGNFYGEFTKYGGSDGNGLGIVLTPRHITNLMAELIDVNRNDYVLDPTAGSGAFLISAMSRMTKLPKSDYDNSDDHIKRNQLIGIEIQEKMYTVATTNMILRGDGKSNMMLADVFQKTAEDLTTNGHGISKVLMNPPYSQGSKRNKQLYEISFIKHALSMMKRGGKLAAIVPIASMTGKSKDEKDFKNDILQHNTLEAVMTLNPQTFVGQRAGVQPVIAIFTSGIPHPENKNVKFVNFKDDGFVMRKHVGLIDDGTAEEKRKKLINVLIYDVDEKTDFVVKSRITADDEWLYSYFYFNDSLPTAEDFSKTVQDYLAFKFDQTIHGKGYLFDKYGDKAIKK